jgi:membrane protease YdiL (CAAX protease family)
VVALVWPLLLGFGVAFPAAVRGADGLLVGLSILIATVNGTLEELLWRGAFVAEFPDDPWRGHVWPAVGFAVWHYAPQVVFPNRMPGGATSLVAVCLVLGLSWGWVARRQRSIRWTALVHVLFDASGLGARMYLR